MTQETVVVIPSEIIELAKSISQEKREQVEKTLSEVFSKTAEWENQVRSINVKDANDKVSIGMADVARKSAKDYRCELEKVFDAKRSEVGALMLEYKQEDALWLKAKQVMQIRLKFIEDLAKEKSEFAKRQEQERIEKLSSDRIYELAKYDITEVLHLNLGNMPDDVYNGYLVGVKTKFESIKEAELLAEKEKAEAEKRAKIIRERELQVAPYMQFLGNKKPNLDDTDKDWDSLISSLSKAKSDYIAEQEKIRLENERLKKEAEAKELESKRVEQERIKKEAELRAKEKALHDAELKNQQDLADKKLREQQAENKRISDELKAKAEAELRAQKEFEELAESELSKGDGDKFVDYMNILKDLKAKHTFKSKKYQVLQKSGADMIDKMIAYFEGKIK